ncbi:MAG: ExbD/TolR family protein [Bacteriovoracaceae bacterium]
MKLRRKAEQKSDIDISPLIDMVFILLIFFMVSTTFVKDMKVDINRPGAASSEMANDKSIRIYVDSGQKIHLDGVQVQSWTLQNRLRELLKYGKDKSVLIVTDSTVPANKLISVVDSCRLAGAKDIGVATEKETGV